MATIYKSVQVEGHPDKLQKDLDALTDDGWTYTDMLPLKTCQVPITTPTGTSNDSTETRNECFILIMQKTI